MTILALAAAMLYGTADFLGGVASRRASVFAVLALTVPAGAVVMVLVASLGQVPALGGLLGHGGLGTPASVGDWSAAGWAAASGVCGAVGLIAFYTGFASAPISVVAPVAALVSAVLPVGVAIAGGERPAATVIAGGLICLVAIVLVSAQPADHAPPEHGQGRDRRHDADRGGGEACVERDQAEGTADAGGRRPPDGGPAHGRGRRAQPAEGRQLAQQRR